MRLLLCFLCLGSFLHAQVRREIPVPDIPDFHTLVCDLHMHTVFSDGTVWPTVRIDEAWRTGFDAIAITDHIEHQPHAKDIPTNHNRPFELCREYAKQRDLVLLRAAEITRSTPPGHFNALFLDDIGQLVIDDFAEAVRAAKQQGGFVFWNHHDWQGEKKGAWLEIHQQLLDSDALHGMEVANGGNYYPRAHEWCIEKNLTMLGNSDIHGPDLRTQTESTDHRTATLVFATKPTAEGIHEALKAGRTAVWFDDQVIGHQKFLEPLFAACVSADPPHHRDARHAWLRVRNRSPFDFQFSRTAGQGPRRLALPANSVTLLRLPAKTAGEASSLEFTVDNFLIAPETPLPASYSLPAGP